MMPFKVIVAGAMMFFSLALALPEPIPVAVSEAVPAVLPEAAPVAVREAKELVSPLQACTPAGASCKVATLSCCLGYTCVTTGALSGTCQLLINLAVTTTTKATAKATAIVKVA